MLDLTTLAKLVTASLLLTSPVKAHPHLSNESAPTACNATSSSATIAPPTCQTFYPTEYRVMNSRYPAWDQSPLHSQKDFFMLLRQRSDTFQVTTQVQFTGLQVIPPENENKTTCYLQLQLPTKEMQVLLGTQPIFNVYQVEREASVPASWNTYALAVNSSLPVFGAMVNGTLEAQGRAWNETGGLVDIGGTRCNETLTWQMGLAFDGGDEVNYWDFIGVSPPVNPVQGFRVVMGC